MKGQASIELMITIGIVLAFTIPVLFLLFSITSINQENAQMAQADATVRSLADSVNFVYGEGVGAKRVILLNIPSSVKKLDMADNEIVLETVTSAGAYDAAAPVFAWEVQADDSIRRVGSDFTGLTVFEIEAFESSDNVVVRVRVREE